MAQQLGLPEEEALRRVGRAAFFFTRHSVFRLRREASGRLMPVGIDSLLLAMDIGDAYAYLSPHDDTSRRQTAAALTLPEELRTASQTALQPLCDGAQQHSACTSVLLQAVHSLELCFPLLKPTQSPLKHTGGLPKVFVYLRDGRRLRAPLEPTIGGLVQLPSTWTRGSAAWWRPCASGRHLRHRSTRWCSARAHCAAVSVYAIFFVHSASDSGQLSLTAAAFHFRLVPLQPTCC